MKNKSKVLVLSAIALFGMTAAVSPTFRGNELRQTFADSESAAYDFTSSIPATVTATGSPTKDSNSRGHGKSNGGTFSFTTTATYSNVTKVVVNSSTNGNASLCSVSVTIGGVSFGSATLSAKEATDYTITGGPLSGVVKVENSNGNSSKSQWIKGFTVYYSNAAVETFDVVFDLNGGSGSKATEHPNRAAEYTIPNASGITPPADKAFDYWSGSNGSVYHAGDKISANTFNKDYSLTLTAVWKDKPVKPTDYTEVDISDGTSKINVPGESTQMNAKKGGTSDSGFSITLKDLPAGTNKIVVYGAAWKGYNKEASIGAVKATFSADESISGNSPYSIEKDNIWDESYRMEFTIDPLAAKGDVTISFSGRGVLWYAGYQADSIQSIVIKTNPKTAYARGEKLNPSGLVITATYKNKTEDIKYDEHRGDFSFDPSLDTQLTDEKSVTVTYKDKTATFNIDVATINGISITKQPDKVSFREGETFDPSGIEVEKTLTHSDESANTTASVTTGLTYSISGHAVTTNTELTQGDNQVVTVSYTEGGVTKTATYTINVGAPYVIGITPSNTEITLGPGNELELKATVSPAKANQNYSVLVASGDGNLNGCYTFIEGVLKINDNNTQSGDLKLEVVTEDVNASGDHLRAECTVHVIASKVSVLQGLDVDGTPAYATQYVGHTFNDYGLEFKPVFDNEPAKTVTVNNNEITWNELVAGQHPTGSYTYDGVTVQVVVESVTVEEDGLASISLDGTLSKTEYYENDSAFSAAGLSISGKMKSGDNVEAGDDLLAGATITFNKTPGEVTDGKVTATAKLQGFADSSIEFDVTINANELQSIVADTTDMKTKYVLGETIVTTGLKVNATYANSVENGITDDITTNADQIDMFSIGDKDLTVTYGGKSTTVTIKVEGMAIEKQWNKLTSMPAEGLSGDYLITYGNYALNGGLQTIDDTKNFVALPENNGTVENTDALYGARVTITNKGTYYSIQTAAGNYIGNSTTSNKLESSATTVYENTITFKTVGNESGFAIAGSASSPKYLKFNTNNDQLRFRYTGSSTDIVQLYEYNEIYEGSVEAIKMTEAIYAGELTDPKVGDVVNASEFMADVLFNTGVPETIDEGLTINGGSEVTLESGDNVITVGYAGLTATVTINARDLVKAETIKINEKSASDMHVFGGKTTQLSATLGRENDSLKIDDEGIEWSSSNTDVATVDENGLVTFADVATDTTVTITATAKDSNDTLKDTITIYVDADTVESIEVTTNPTKLNYDDGDSFDPTGLVITRTYKSGKTDTVAYNDTTKADFSFDVTTFDKTKNVDTVDVTVTYNGKSDTITCNVSRVFVSAEVNHIEYTKGEQAYTGTIYQHDVVVATVYIDKTYSDGSKDTNVALTPVTLDTSVAGTFTITDVEGLANDPTYTVAAVTLNSISIQTAPAKTTYLEGEAFDPAGMVVVANYNNENSVPVTNYTLSDNTDLAAGTQSVKISYEGKETTQTVNVLARNNPVQISVSGNYSTSVVVGEQYEFNGLVNATYSNGATGVLSSSQYTVSVDTSTIGEATVTITANGTDHASYTFKINVTYAPTQSLALTHNATNELHIGDTFNVTAIAYPQGTADQNVTFVSTNTDVATVSNDGVVSIVGNGTFGIYAVQNAGTANEIKSETFTFTVTTKVTGVTLDQTTLVLDTEQNPTAQLVATVTPTNATNQNVTWTSSDPTTVYVDQSGNVSALKEGSATITVTTEDGSKTASCAVTVISPTIDPVGEDDGSSKKGGCGGSLVAASAIVSGLALAGVSLLVSKKRKEDK